MGNVYVTTPCLHELMRREITISWHSFGGWFIGHTVGTGHKNAELRTGQYRASFDPGVCLRLARALVVAKIQNCRTMLRRNWKEGEAPEALLDGFRQDIELARRAKGFAELLGAEGNAAARYFREFLNVLLLVDELNASYTTSQLKVPHECLARTGCENPFQRTAGCLRKRRAAGRHASRHRNRRARTHCRVAKAVRSGTPVPQGAAHRGHGARGLRPATAGTSTTPVGSRSSEMYLLDTNIVSELRRVRPNGAVMAWVAGVADADLHLCALSLGEIQAGIEPTREQDPAKAARSGLAVARAVAPRIPERTGDVHARGRRHDLGCANALAARY